MTTNWVIQKLECKVSEDGLSNVVYKIYWIYRVTEIVDVEVNGNLISKKYNSARSGVLTLSPPDPLSFTSYNDLTKEQVVGWVVDSLGEEYITSMTTDLDNQNYYKINPLIITPDLPFNN